MKEKRLRGPRAIKWLYRVVSFPFSEEQSLLADQLVIEYKDRERAKEKGKKALTYRKR